MGLISKMLKAIGRREGSAEPCAAAVETKVMSDEEKCAATMTKLNSETAARIEAKRQREAREALHLARCKKVRNFLKERPDRCFNNKLLAKELPAEGEEERKFFEKFSRKEMFYGGYGIECYYQFHFFQDEAGEEFFMYNPQKEESIDGIESADLLKLQV